MSIPSRAEAARLLLALDPPDWLLRHSSAVAEVAAFLAERVAASGQDANRPLVEAAALLHDVDKALSLEHPLKSLRHGAAGARWLSERGFAELAAAVANHPVSLLSDDRHYSAWNASASLEERIVAYADKRATQQLVSLEQRFGEWLERYPDKQDATLRARGRAEELERQVCAAAQVEPREVVRLGWVDEAIGRAPQQP